MARKGGKGSKGKEPGTVIISVGKRMFPFGSTGWGWDPPLVLESIRMTMNSLCAALFIRSSTFFEELPWEPPVDMFLFGDTLVVEISVPGAEKDKVSIHSTSSLLIIDGKVELPEDVREEDFLSLERSYGRFSRTVPLPRPVLPEEMKAEYRDGIIRLVFPLKGEDRRDH
jgi:HSP20 family protein